MVPLHFLTPEYDLPVIPVNINCQGPPLAPLHRAWALGEALRRAADLAARTHCSRRHRRHLALARDAGFGEDQRGLGSRLPDALASQRQAGDAVLHGRGDLSRRRPGRFRDPHLHRGRRRRAGPRITSQHYRPIPIFAVGCTIADMAIASVGGSDMSHMTLEYSGNLRAAAAFRRAVPQTRALHDELEVDGQAGVSARRRAGARHPLR